MRPRRDVGASRDRDVETETASLLVSLNYDAQVATVHIMRLYQSCPWVGLTHGLGWVGSTTAKVL